jgi:two-component system phosphate regulon response regulator PhoB
MNSYHILVVDDEVDLCEILQFNLEKEGYKVDVAYSAEKALKKELTHYDLILLDVMMGEISGFKMASLLRANPKTASLAIVFLTAKDSDNDKLTGFALGAEDYIAKPYSIRELVARVNAILRRRETSITENTADIDYETLKMSLLNKKVLLNNCEVPCTKKEFEILKLFLENRNRVFTREEILARVWLDEEGVLSRTIDVNITRLRKKLGPYEKNIVTRLGYGYCFEG